MKLFFANFQFRLQRIDITRYLNETVLLTQSFVFSDYFFWFVRGLFLLCLYASVCSNSNEHRKAQCLSLPFDPTNQSFPYLPMTNFDDHTDLARQMNAVALIHANSLGDLQATAMDYHDFPSNMPTSRMTVSNVTTPYGRPPSPRVFQRQMSFSEDDISFVNSNGIGWHIPQTVNSIDPLLRVRSRARIASLKALKNIPLSLKAFKSSVPIQSQTAPMNRVPVVNERIVQSIQMQARNSRSLKHLFNKSHSLNPAENRSTVVEKPRKNSIPYTGRNASNIIRRKMNHENQQHFGQSDRVARDKKSISLDLSLLGQDADEIPNEMDPYNDGDGGDDAKPKMHGIRRFSRRSSGRRTKAKQFFRESREVNAKSGHISEMINAFSDDDLRIENRSPSFGYGSDEVFESPKHKLASEHSSKTAPNTDKSVQRSNDIKSANKPLRNNSIESPNHRRSSVVKPVALDSCRNPIIANHALNSSPKYSKPRDVPNESQPNNKMPLNNSEYDVQDRSGATAHSSRASGEICSFG